MCWRAAGSPATDHLDPNCRQACWEHLKRDFTRHAEGLAEQGASRTVACEKGPHHRGVGQTNGRRVVVEIAGRMEFTVVAVRDSVSSRWTGREHSDESREVAERFLGLLVGGPKVRVRATAFFRA
jgi:hypothetical protein